MKCSSVKKRKMAKDRKIIEVIIIIFSLDFGYITLLFPQICFAEERKHNLGMLADSGLLPLIERCDHSPLGQPMCVYGDPAYPLRVHLQAPFRKAVLTPQMEACNTCMTKVRISVE